jgi:hypothetical protein
MWAAGQQTFAAALLDPEQPVPTTLSSHTARTPIRRFAVYRNNVVFGLISALRTRFPAVERIVGEECFATMARDFVVRHPPTSPLLMFYGDAFADFIATLAPLAELPYLPDVARLEAARTHAYHAADATPLGPTNLQHVSADDLIAARIVLHPSAHIVRSYYPIVTIWAMNSGEAELCPIDGDEPEDALVIRPDAAVNVVKLPPGGAAFLKTLAAGCGLGRAAERAREDHANFDLTANLAVLIASGAIAALHPAHDQVNEP